MTSRTPKQIPALRLLAAGCLLIWLLASSYCSVEYLFGSHHRGDSDVHILDNGCQTVANTDGAEHHEKDDAHHSTETEGNGHRSHHHDGKEDHCCSTLQATALTVDPIHLSKPAFTPTALLCVLLEARDLISRLADNPSLCQAKSRDWVFTPEVCTGPANRTHAPPASV